MIKEKFEELYAQYKGFKNYAEEFNKTFEERRKQAIEKAKDATEDELFEMFLEIDAFPEKLSHDLDVTVDRLLTVYMSLPKESKISDEVREELKGLNRFNTYYVFADGEVKKVNEQLHEATDAQYRALAKQYIDKQSQEE